MSDTQWVKEHFAAGRGESPTTETTTAILLKGDGSLEEVTLRAIVFANELDGLAVYPRLPTEGKRECRVSISSVARQMEGEFRTGDLSINPGAGNVISVSSHSSSWTTEHLLSLARSKLDGRDRQLGVHLLEKLAKKDGSRETLELLKREYDTDGRHEDAAVVQKRLDSLE